VANLAAGGYAARFKVWDLLAPLLSVPADDLTP
jgi:hypothetical protein